MKETVSDVGERELIKMASSIYKEHNPFVDLTDDCAIIPIADEYILSSSDMISEKTHIPHGMTPWQIGWFITAVNLSDIAAKGGKPVGILLSLGMPQVYPISSFLELIKGASSCATHYKTSIIGGDTKENDHLVISGTALGRVNKNFFMSRKGVQSDDVIAVTGTLGKAAAGFYSLKNQEKSGEINALCEPIPRVAEGQKLAETRLVHSCMDLSDGLSSSLYQLAELNHVGFEIEKEKLPISKELHDIASHDSTVDDLYLSLHYGGDYELLIAASKKNISLFQKKLKESNVSLTVIGRVSSDEEGVFISESNGKKDVLPNLGYEHFTNK